MVWCFLHMKKCPERLSVKSQLLASLMEVPVLFRI